MSNRYYDETHIQNIADAIRYKNTETTAYKISDMAEAIRNIPTEAEDLYTELEGYDNGLDRESIILNQLNEIMLNRGLPIRESTIQLKDINFFDYDGTLLHSYTMKELKYLDKLPDPPTHQGLVFQDWNWTLDQIKENNAPVDVGAMYTTDDGTNRFYITLPTELNLALTFQAQGTVSIDWGDGSDIEEVVCTNILSYTVKNHEYYSGGNYVIKLKLVEIPSTVNNKIRIEGKESGKSYLFRPYPLPGSTEKWDAYQAILTKVECHNLDIRSYSFANCRNLKSITTNRDTFYYSGLGKELRDLHSLKYITIPDNMIAVGYEAFNDSTGLENISIPFTVNKIKDFAFDSCEQLSRITLSKNINYLGLRSIYYTLISKIYIHNNATETSADKESPVSLCRALQEATVEGTSINPRMFEQCISLFKVVLKGQIDSINYYAFSADIRLELVDCRQITNIPALTDISAFNGVTSNYKIVVPDDLFDEWIIAENWSNETILPHITKQSDYERDYLTLSELPELLEIESKKQITVGLDFGGRATAIREKTLVLEATCSTPFFNFTYDIDYTSKKCYVTIKNIVPTEEEYGVESDLYITLSDGNTLSTMSSGKLRLLPLKSEYKVENVAGANYNFELNANNYYESKNKGLHNTAALCKVTFRTDTRKLYVDCINYAESNYDFGLLSKIDKTLSTSSSVDTSSLLQKNFSGQQSPYVQTVTYDIPDSNEHFIYIKYKKDGSVNSNYDTLQFKIRFE